MRYDLGLEKPWFLKYLDKDLTEDVVAGYRNMDDPKIIQTIYDLACEAAEQQVKVEHFFPKRAGRSLRPARREPRVRVGTGAALPAVTHLAGSGVGLGAVAEFAAEPGHGGPAVDGDQLRAR